MNNPQYAEVNNKRYKINTDYRVAIECDYIARDKNITDVERALAILYKLYGEEALNDNDNQQGLMKIALKYLSIGKDEKTLDFDCGDNERDIDLKQDMDYIKASFMSDFHIDLDKTDYMHWWTFYNLLSGLSNSEFGNCCILNRIRNIRNLDTSKIKDAKERAKMEKIKKQVALKKEEIKISKKQEESMNKFYNKIGL